METKVITIDHKSMDEAVLQEAGTIIKNGGLVAFPTETVYGLGGDALNKFLWILYWMPPTNPKAVGAFRLPESPSGMRSKPAPPKSFK